MKQSPQNPSSNRLPSGVKAEALHNAIIKSGYPLQLEVAANLDGRFLVIEEWGYLDRETKEPRALDVHAHKSVLADPNRQIQPELVLLIECKRSDLPYVFFEAAIARPPRGYPQIFGVEAHALKVYNPRRAYMEVSLSDFLRPSDLPFISEGPPLSRAFSRVERPGEKMELSGEVPYRSVMLPLLSAMHHWQEMRREVTRRERYLPSITLNVCVLDAPMVAVRGSPIKAAPELTPWTRVMRQESFLTPDHIDYRNYVVDFVHKDFLDEFIDKYVLPFATQLSDRVR
jgi:hypothetical protein